MGLIDEGTPYVEHRKGMEYLIYPEAKGEPLEVHKRWVGLLYQPMTELVLQARGWTVDDARRWIKL